MPGPHAATVARVRATTPPRCSFALPCCLLPAEPGYESSACGAAVLSALAAHSLHRVTPRSEQITQMKVPHSMQGYPSDARSSLPQERHIIPSCSLPKGTSSSSFRTQPALGD